MTDPLGKTTAKDVPAGKRAKPGIDWETIEREYRAGILSLRDIAAKHGLSETAIRKRAKKHEWERDLTQRVHERVRTALVRSVEARGDNAHQTKTEREIVEQAAATVVEVVRQHREDIRRTAALVARLTEQLSDAADCRERLRDLIEEETAKDRSPNRRVAMLRAVAIPAHAGTAKDLSIAMKNLVGLERQAFNVPAIDPDPPPAGDDKDAGDDPGLMAVLTRLSTLTGAPIVTEGGEQAVEQTPEDDGGGDGGEAAQA
jgi:hypothetical protein